jgi:hypothetical protein
MTKRAGAAISATLQQRAASLDHLVGAQQERFRDH